MRGSGPAQARGPCDEQFDSLGNCAVSLAWAGPTSARNLGGNSERNEAGTVLHRVLILLPLERPLAQSLSRGDNKRIASTTSSCIEPSDLARRENDMEPFLEWTSISVIVGALLGEGVVSTQKPFLMHVLV